LLPPSRHGQLQVIKEQDQRKMFDAKKGFLRQSLQRMLKIGLTKKCIVDQFFFLLPKFLPKKDISKK
jgi:hypothetical protein